MAKRLTLEKRIRLETLLKLPFDGLMGNLSMAKKQPTIAKLLEISQSTIHREYSGRPCQYQIISNLRYKTTYLWLSYLINYNIIKRLLPEYTLFGTL